MNPEEPPQSEPSFVKKFDIPLPKDIIETEKEMYGHLFEATTSWGGAHKNQIKDPYYPEDATDEEIILAAEQNPDIFNPYTKVRKIDGRISAQAYHEIDAEVATKTAVSLKKAAELSSDPKYKNYLLTLAEAVVNGNYKEAEKARAEVEEEPLFDITLGYYERYMDAWLGINEIDKTNLAQGISDKYLDTQGWKGAKVRTRVDQIALLSGFIAAIPSPPSATSLPNQKEWREEFGTRITFFENSFEKSISDVIPTLRGIDNESKEYTDDEIRQISFKLLAAHESFHPVIRYNSDETRLGNEFTYVNEILCDLLSQKVSADLIGTLITEKEMRLAVPLLISKAIALKNNGMPQENGYMLGWTTVINYLVENGSIKIEYGKIKQISHQSVREGIEDLTIKFQQIAKDGTGSDAQDLKEKYNKSEIYDHFGTKR
jgi:hypothetical protein